ncbi:hypothetical protein EUTSA_v10016113mg [Eutrema salsugineum]|uniref:F-box domain-containing protein n=1 Tax=Eutrema salsugineum TaxID=72664 RepID=V4NB71_EUTSA|nr:hypothetical protein EUTSA_v10016113mg [Eutrema salsugineum]
MVPTLSSLFLLFFSFFFRKSKREKHQSSKMSDTNHESSSFNALNIDVTESILSLLPIPSLVRFSSV